GRPPFAGATAADVLAAVLTAEPAPLDRHTPARLAQLVGRALRKDRGERYPRASSMMSDLLAVRQQLDTGAAHPLVSAAVRDDEDSALSAAGERRRGTVLVSIVSDYASIIERFAAANVDRILAQVRSAALEIVGRHGGIVNQAIGEEIVSLFGIPTAHEDDAI